MHTFVIFYVSEWSVMVMWFLVVTPQTAKLEQKLSIVITRFKMKRERIAQNQV